jgi:PAS domain S-box-containing protein
MNYEDYRQEFFDLLQNPGCITSLFEHLPDIYFFAKNKDLKFVMCNKSFAEKCGVTNETGVVGKSDFDFFPNDLAQKYNDDDLSVLNGGDPIINRIELVPNEDETIDWHSTNKEPIYSHDGTIIGVMGITRNLKQSDALLHPYMTMSSVIDFISANYQSRIDVDQLAKIAALSVSQFERKFKQTFQRSPMSFVIKVRIKAACTELINTDDSVSNIALKLGFYDQSHFSKQFTRAMSIPPKTYRKQYKQKNPL